MNSDSIDTLNANVSMNDQFIKSNIASTYLMINSCCKIFLRDFEFKTVYNTCHSSVFRILILRVPSVNRIFPLRLLTAGAISLFLNITGAIAPVAPVLNTPLQFYLP